MIIIAKALRQNYNGVYELQVITIILKPKTLSCILSKQLVSTLWHKCLGHPHYQTMGRMVQHQSVLALPDTPIIDLSCEVCFKGKQTRSRIPKTRTQHSTHILELIHTDITRPFRVTLLGGARYFLVFVDDFSKYTFVYFLSEKSECFTKFWLFHHFVKRLTGRQLKILCFDNGTEFLSSDYKTYCDNHGIRHNLFQPCTPHQNGVAEWRNQTLQDVTCCLLLEQNLFG